MKTGSHIRESSRVLVPLVGGFTLSAASVFALASIIGGAFDYGGVVLTTSLAATLAVFAVIDLSFPWLRPPMIRRQTPKRLVGRFSPPIGGFLWGLDTGSVVSTFRASSASWAGFLLVMQGWAPVWLGLIYAAAFCLPLIFLVSVAEPSLIRRGETAGPASRGRSPRAEATDVVSGLGSMGRRVRLASALLLGSGVALIGFDVLGG